MTRVVSIAPDTALLETGSEPEFFVSGIAKFEFMAGGLIRLYLATQKGNCLRLEYTAIVSADSLAAMGRACLQMAADSHTLTTFQEEVRAH